MVNGDRAGPKAEGGRRGTCEEQPGSTEDIAEAIVMSDHIVVLGYKPARILADLRVCLPRPRNVAKVHSERGELFQRIWNLLEVAAV